MEAHKMFDKEKKILKSIIESAYTRGFKMGVIITSIVAIIIIIIMK